MSVFAFFAISGFFITRSFATRSSLVEFVLARVLRLFPALLVMLVVSTVVLGLFVTTAASGAYWSLVPQYIFHQLSLMGGGVDPPGLFETNPYPHAINGFLWSLFFEVLCYADVVLLGLLGLLTQRRFAFVVAFCLLSYMAGQIHQMRFTIDMLMYVGMPFMVGMICYIWRDRIPLRLSIVAALVLLAALMRIFFLPAFEATFMVALSYTVILLGFSPSPFLQRYNRLGDYSYGMYVYAFPVQQTLAHFLSPMSPIENMALAFPVTLSFAALSWHLVEKPALTLKRRKAEPTEFATDRP